MKLPEMPLEKKSFGHRRALSSSANGPRNTSDGRKNSLDLSSNGKEKELKNNAKVKSTIIADFFEYLPLVFDSELNQKIMVLILEALEDDALCENVVQPFIKVVALCDRLFIYSLSFMIRLYLVIIYPTKR
jgi:hypothetical protein